MKITFCSNFMNHHQEALSKALFELTGGEYRFVACMPIDAERLCLGYEDMNRKYDFILRPYESEAQKEEAIARVMESDVLIFGAGDTLYFQKFMEKGGLTLRYIERPFKKGTYRRLVPITMQKIYKGYKANNIKNMHFLCTGAYAARDLALCGFPRERFYRWGYFPGVQEYDVEKLMAEKTPHSLLWVGRFINWKHPHLAIKTAEILRDMGEVFHLTMVGDGVEMPCIQKMIKAKKLEDLVTLTGSVPAENVRAYMEKAEIFLATSNFQEGWGAVLNEAMNSGCAVLASHAMGGAPYLIQNGENGFLYKSGDVKTLSEKVVYLLHRGDERRRMGIAAYETVRGEWNPENAAEKVYGLCDALLGGGEVPLSGICARAELLKNNWF